MFGTGQILDASLSLVTFAYVNTHAGCSGPGTLREHDGAFITWVANLRMTVSKTVDRFTYLSPLPLLTPHSFALFYTSVLSFILLSQVGGSLPGGISLRGLSGGERKRLAIAAGIMGACVFV